MLTHIYGVCVSVCGWVDRDICFFSAVRHPTRAISITRETSELKFHLTVTPWPLPGTSEHCCFLFNNTTMFALSEGLSLLLFKKKFKVGRNLLNIYICSCPHKQPGLCIMLILKSSVCSDRQRKLHSILHFGYFTEPRIQSFLIYVCKQ